MSVEKEFIFKEPSSGRRRDYKPWEATPLDLNDRKVLKHQAEVAERFKNLIISGRPETVPKNVSEYLLSIFSAVDAKREARNIVSYNSRSIKIPPASLSKEQLERANRGLASINELREVRSELGMRSIELAKLSFFYGYRSEHIESMEDDLEHSLGELAFDCYKVDAFTDVAVGRNPNTGEKQLNAITLRKKAKITLPDSGAVIKRSDVMVCQVGEGFTLPQAEAAAIIKFTSDFRNREIDSGGESAAHLASMKRVYPQYIEPIIETGPTHPDVVGGVTTVYEYDPSLV